MSDSFWNKISYYMGFLPIGALFGLAAFAATIEIKDLDIWLHLAMGKFILTHGYVPSVDVLSFTIKGAPWINHEWLFQILLYSIYSHFGPDGLLKMQAVLVVVTMMILLFLGYNKEKQLAVIFGLLLVFLVYEQRFTIRPDLFSLLFFALYIFVLALHIDKRWSVAALFLIQVLWTNFHGFFFFGPLFVLLGLVSEWTRRHVKLPYEWNETGNLTDQEYRRLKIVLGAVIVACLFNPCTFKGAWYPIGVFFTFGGENKIFFQYIQELQKPFTLNNFFSLQGLVFYKFLIGISFLTFIFNRRRIDISALFFWLVFLLFSIAAIRNCAFFAFAAYLVFITNILNIKSSEIIPVRFTAKKFQYLTSAIAKVLLLIWILNYSYGKTGQGYYDFAKYERKSEFGGVALRSFPQKAVQFLKDNKIKGRFFNDFNSGAYLVGTVYPDIKVFIDGRTEVYGGAFFKQYLKVWEDGDTKVFDALVEKYNITGAFLNTIRQRAPKAILKYLYQHKDWKLVYLDYDAVIFLRNIPENADSIGRLAIDLNKREAVKPDLFKIGSSPVVPFESYYRAYTLESLEMYDQAMAEAEQAIKIMPNYAEAYNLMGKVYAERKNYEQAFEKFRLAASISPGDIEIRDNLAMAYYDLGKYDLAVKQYEMMRSSWPNDPKIQFLLARAYVKNKQYDDAIGLLRSLHKKEPSNSSDVTGIGDAFYEAQKYNFALESYQLALETQRNRPVILTKLGKVYKASGEIEKSKQYLMNALSLEPDNEEIKKELSSY